MGTACAKHTIYITVSITANVRSTLLRISWVYREEDGVPSFPSSTYRYRYWAQILRKLAAVALMQSAATSVLSGHLTRVAKRFPWHTFEHGLQLHCILRHACWVITCTWIHRRLNMRMECINAINLYQMRVFLPSRRLLPSATHHFRRIWHGHIRQTWQILNRYNTIKSSLGHCMMLAVAYCGGISIDKMPACDSASTNSVGYSDAASSSRQYAPGNLAHSEDTISRIGCVWSSVGVPPDEKRTFLRLELLCQGDVVCRLVTILALLSSRKLRCKTFNVCPQSMWWIPNDVMMTLATM